MDINDTMNYPGYDTDKDCEFKDSACFLPTWLVGSHTITRYRGEKKNSLYKYRFGVHFQTNHM